jgi:endonuclease YncB( thermonuclease family)
MVSRRAANEMIRCLAIALMMLVASSGARSDDLAERASIIDGDTLAIHGARIRLWGIDAPETDQLCSNQGG